MLVVSMWNQTIEQPHIAKMRWFLTPMWIFDCEIGRRIGLLLSKHRIVDYARSPLVSTNELMSWIRCDRWGRHTKCAGLGLSRTGLRTTALLKMIRMFMLLVFHVTSPWKLVWVSFWSISVFCLDVMNILVMLSVVLSLQTLCSAWCVMKHFL